jgi:8-oxo-dGTP diphosphatase
MKEYTIGALFTHNFSHVLMVHKTKPDWQKGKMNLPGGKIEDNETVFECVSREFTEETGLAVPYWKYIGMIENIELDYKVHFLTAVLSKGDYHAAKSLTDELVEWVYVNEIFRNQNKFISNIPWLVCFAENMHNQNNFDVLQFGHFKYSKENSVFYTM